MLATVLVSACANEGTMTLGRRSLIISAGAAQKGENKQECQTNATWNIR